ncbi:MAG: hypothetical protein COZ80_06875 [Ignavibacteria bacterium CG_4_8_14_3_um_filter_37_9]|nr:GAF domain-containing protein [Ignavibacteria bacterium]OIO22937.1 MAG: hypothetical protein AUJ54_02735 [Ignavibacteria bacterium CG1_02_37_35]PIP76938.1 MAG: hypothetical protein COW85_11605 [Ignavibacteria bacterium CG22_combo_CG10-13_8_21_14_all_37_15]PIS46357.1 MAG: hypothetical protein COT22_00460 [Ignavibacteria bacterium CG08_land_8_20_14_0_20_37_9]PIW99167.1 MAG: hypothetical protein COZ80_06875 [Ignavibacteria bacterium CG_4_8_14_3_um_filter_37_9]PIX93447.1 MAG: hypothetical prote
MKFSDFKSSLDQNTKTEPFSEQYSEKSKTLELILDITKSLNRTLILEDVLTLVLNNAILLTNSDRGFIVLKNSREKLDFAIGLNSKGNPLAEKDFQVSTTVVDEVFHTGLASFIEEAQSDTNYDISKSILLLNLQTILCAPLIIGDKKIGVIYLDSKSLNKIKIKEITYAFEILAGQAAIAIQNAQAFKKQIDANKELNEARIVAEKSSKFKSSLMKNMSHEFRTPMIGILGLGEILRESLSAQDDVLLLDRIMEDSNRLLTTLSKILDLSDIETCTIQLKSEVIEVGKVIGDIAFSSAHAAEEKLLEFIVDIKNDFFLKFDKSYFHQLVESLVENAIKYTSRGQIKITTEVVDGKGIIKVSDTGIGISQEHYETIFEAFRQASEGFERSYDGCGLGLTLVKRIVDLAGGSISVESKVGVGSTFILTFPDLEPSENFSQKHRYQGKVSNPRLYRIPNVLLVGGNRLNLVTFQTFLQNKAVLEIALTPKTALRLASKNIFNLILIDVNPGESAASIELMKELKGLNKDNEIPIVAVIRAELESELATLKNEGFSDCLLKPFKKNQLIDTIKNNFHTPLKP